MGFAVEDVFGFEYTSFVNDLTHSATSRSTLFVFESLVFFFPIFLWNITFGSHGLSLLELLICKYNCSFGMENMTYNLLLLTKDMGLKKKPFDKRNKIIWKGKSKIHVIIKSNGGSLKKGYQCGYTIKMFYLLPLVLEICYYEKKTH